MLVGKFLLGWMSEEGRREERRVSGDDSWCFSDLFVTVVGDVVD